MDSTWEKRLVKRYYDKLFKEYPFFIIYMILFFFSGEEMQIVGIYFIRKCSYVIVYI